MSIGEWLGWGRSLLDTMGLTNYVIAFFVITLGVALVRQFFGGRE